ncbi:MAG: sulfide/dihydroorotate dehydrogenase-like FAD/NAD-binding protein, partial [Thermoplasmatales archaeon]|nr:sulfide/dihydroorotate dehydrogenase-like FAD/NAD-binding protein [Thermoplasmatales archaeon]
SDILQNLIDKEKRIDIVWAIGPVIMMKVVANLTKKYDIKTIVSLNPIMVDGTGMCGGCRVEVGGKTKFACVDGPEFDGHKVDFNNLMLRNRRFLHDEEEACKMLEETR